MYSRRITEAHKLGMKGNVQLRFESRIVGGNTSFKAVLVALRGEGQGRMEDTSMKQRQSPVFPASLPHL